MLKTLLNESRNMMVLKKSFRALGAIKSIEKRGVIVHGTYYNATIAVYVTLNLRLGKDDASAIFLGNDASDHVAVQQLAFGTNR